MNVKELIDIINLFQVHVIFDNPKDSVDRLMAGGSPLYFTPIEGKERKKYEQSSNKSEIISTTDAIHVIDLDIRKLVNIFECDGTGIHELTKEKIRPYCSNNISEDIVYVAFLFLHEVGHWDQFICMSKNIERFINEDLQLEKEIFEKNQQLGKQQKERIKKGSSCILTTNERKLFEQYMLEYREIPKEKYADKFALKNMEVVLDKYKNHNN